MEYQHIIHTIPPIWDNNSKILILGSFPSVKSREVEFFYGHPQNRFWRVLSFVLNEETPQTIDKKRLLLQSHGIALWDVIQQCDIVGSSDSSIKNVVPNDIKSILDKTNIKHIFVNGNTAKKLYDKYLLPDLNINAVRLPSTSPANAAWSFEKLCKAWEIIKNNP